MGRFVQQNKREGKKRSQSRQLSNFNSNFVPENRISQLIVFEILLLFIP